MKERQDRENIVEPQNQNQDISFQIQLFVKKECEKARNQAIGVLGFVALLLALIGGFGLNWLFQNAVKQAVDKTGLKNTSNEAKKYLTRIIDAERRAKEAADSAEFGKPNYDSGWFKVKKGDQLSLKHKLGQIPKRYRVFIKRDEFNDMVYLGNQIWCHMHEAGRGIMLTNITQDKLTVRVGRKYLYDSFPAGKDNDRLMIESGYVQVLCWK